MSGTLWCGDALAGSRRPVKISKKKLLTIGMYHRASIPAPPQLFGAKRFFSTTAMAASLHQIARGGDVEEGEKFFREVTDSRGEKAANTVDGMQRCESTPP